DLLIQSSIQFDAFGVRYPMGQAVDGQFTRDLMQVSSMLDQFAGFGKQVFLTVGVPSEPVTEMMIASTKSDDPVDDNSGYWRRPWSPVVQGHWLEAVMQIAMSKPYIEGVSWTDLVDHANIELPLSALVNDDQQPKAGFKRLVNFRRNLGMGAHQADSAAPQPGSV
ncbi:MAG: hypothetical protein AAGJ38_09625, partial [Planctomycetota bacterium]